jgi:hypothetical protein
MFSHSASKSNPQFHNRKGQSLTDMIEYHDYTRSLKNKIAIGFKQIKNVKDEAKKKFGLRFVLKEPL